MKICTILFVAIAAAVIHQSHSLQTISNDVATERVSGSTESSCTDSDDDCKDWARMGECQLNPAYMESNCCLSCKTEKVSTGCTDVNTMCPHWASIGECEKNPDYMMIGCCESCKGECWKTIVLKYLHCLIF